MTEQKVSAPQFFSLLFLSSLNTVFMYISSADVYIAQSDALLRPVVFCLVSFISALPQFFIYKLYVRNKEKGLIVKNTGVLKAFALCFGVIYFLSVLRSVSRFDLFASSELFPGSDMTIVIIAIVVVCSLLSLLGFGALCRGSVVFTFIVISVTAFVMISLADEVDVLNFTPFFLQAPSKFLGDSLLFSLQITELGTIFMFFKDIKGNVKNNFIAFVLSSGGVFASILFFVIGSLGAFADTQLFPTYASVTLAGLGLLERIDALETAVWVLCVVLKISFYILVVVKTFGYAFKKIPPKIVCGIVCAVLCSILVFISGNIELFGFVSSEIFAIVLYCLGVVVLPLGVLLYLKGGKAYEKACEDN